MVGLVCSRVVASEEKAGTASRKALPSQVHLACRFEMKQKGQKHLFTRGLKAEQIVSRSDRGLDMVFRITWYGTSGATCEMHLAGW
jgi:hypothetical protein